MSRLRCRCCGWKIRLANNRPDVIAACSNCSQVVQVPDIPPWAIPECRTDALVAWDGQRNPQANEWAPLLPVELCVPLRKPHSVRAYAGVGLLCIGVSLFFAVPSGFPQSLPERLFFGCVGSSFFLAGAYLLSVAFRKFRRCSRGQVLSTARLPQGVEHWGTPFALHRNQDATPFLLLVAGVLLTVGGAVCAILRLYGDIQDERMTAAAVCGLLGGVIAFLGIGCCRRLRLLIYPEGFVVLRGRETGVLWRWQDVESISLEPNNPEAPLRLLSYTLRHKDGEMFTFDYHCEYTENQFGVRVQYLLLHQRLPPLLRDVHAGEPALFGSLRVSREGLHHLDRFVPWWQVANITLDGFRLTIRKWGGDYGTSWSVSYSAIPNLALFFALTQHLLREATNESENALSVLAGRGDSRDSLAMQAYSLSFQPPSPVRQPHGDQTLD